VSSVVDHFSEYVIDASGEQSCSCEVHFLSFSFLSLLLISTLYQRFLSCQVLNKCFFEIFFVCANTMPKQVFHVWHTVCVSK
jgi:hypothetical protein